MAVISPQYDFMLSGHVDDAKTPPKTQPAGTAVATNRRPTQGIPWESRTVTVVRVVGGIMAIAATVAACTLFIPGMPLAAFGVPLAAALAGSTTGSAFIAASVCLGTLTILVPTAPFLITIANSDGKRIANSNEKRLKFLEDYVFNNEIPSSEMNVVKKILKLNRAASDKVHALLALQNLSDKSKHVGLICLIQSLSPEEKEEISIMPKLPEEIKLFRSTNEIVPAQPSFWELKCILFQNQSILPPTPQKTQHLMESGRFDREQALITLPHIYTTR